MSWYSPSNLASIIGLGGPMSIAFAIYSKFNQTVFPPKDLTRWKVTNQKPKEPAHEGKQKFVPQDVDLFVRLVNSDGQKMRNDLQQLFNALKDIANKDPEDPNAEVMKKALFKLLYMEGFSETLGHSSNAAPQTGLHVLARRVKKSKTNRSFPECEAVFDGLLSRAAGSKTTNQEVSGLAHALGTILSLTLFRVPDNDRHDSGLNGTAPRLDLSPLYGVGATCPIRDPNALTMLLPDCFAEDRVEQLTPTVSALLILFNRHHNYVARRLAAITNHKWDPAKKNDQIFECAKAINCVLFKDIILHDFLKGVLGFPFVEIKVDKVPKKSLKNPGEVEVHKLAKSGFPDLRFLAQERDGTAQDVTPISFVESAQLYDFTTLMSEADEAWRDQLFQTGVAIDKTVKDRRDKRKEEGDRFACPVIVSSGSSGGNLTAGKITRSTQKENEGYFDDTDLAKILVGSVETPAGLPGARGLHPMSKHYVTGHMSQSRDPSWGVCTLNEFRIHLGLEPYRDFDEWNSDREIREEARRLYTTIDNVELYPGLLAENLNGKGFRLGPTQAYGLFKDIITIICNDPRFTKDFHANTLTSWGHKFCQSFCRGSEDGSAIQALLLRTLPRCFPYNHVVVHFPLRRLDDEIKKDLKKIQDAKYSDIGVSGPSQTVVTEWNQIREVMNNKDFATPYAADVKALTNGYGYMLGFHRKQLHAADRQMTMYSLMPDSRTFGTYRHFFNQKATDMIEAHGKDASGGNVTTVDIVRDVINPLCVQWVLETLCGEESGSLPPDVLGDYMQDFSMLYACVFKKFERADEWACRLRAIDTSQRIGNAITERLRSKLHHHANAKNMSSSLLKLVRGFLAKYVLQIFKELTSGRDLDRLSFTFMDRLIKTDHIPGAGQLPESEDSKELEEIADLLDQISYEVQKSNPESSASKDSSANDERSDGLFATFLRAIKLTGTVAPTREERSEKIFAEALEKFRLARLSANVTGLCVMMSVNYASVCSAVVDFYLQKENAKHKQSIIALVHLQIPEDGRVSEWIDNIKRLQSQPFGPFPEGQELLRRGTSSSQGGGSQVNVPKIPRKLQDFLLMNYIREAQRLKASPLLERKAQTGHTHTSLGLDVSEGESIFADFNALHLNEDLFPNATEVDPIRQIYIYHGTGSCTDSSVITQSCPQHPNPVEIKQCKEQTDQHRCAHSQFNSCGQPDTNQGCGLHVGRGCASASIIDTPCQSHARGESCKIHGFRPWSIQGLGVHKCPGLSFCDNTMPELLKAIFSLKNVRLPQESRGIAASKFRLYKHRLEDPIPNLQNTGSNKQAADPGDLTLYTDRTGETFPYPPTMMIQFDKSSGSEDPKAWLRPKRLYPEYIDKAIIVLLVGSLLFYFLWVPCLRIQTPNLLPWLAIIPRLSGPSRLIPPAKPCCGQEDSATTLKNSTCNPPITVFRSWDVNTFFPGHDGHPAPVEYTLERSNPHRLSLIDIDKRDMQLGVFVDGVFMGHTSDFQLDPWANCSPESPGGLEACVSKGFSKGSFVVPAGKHAVRIVWAGKEYQRGTTSLDWGQEQARRFMWRLENCG